jgi:hypothetical protein
MILLESTSIDKHKENHKFFRLSVLPWNFTDFSYTERNVCEGLNQDSISV